MEIRTRFALVVLGLTVAAAAPASAQAKLPTGVTPAMVAKGKTVFTSTGLCFACHGMDGKGAVGPEPRGWHVDPREGRRLSRAWCTIITKGISAAEAKTGKGPMPPKGGATISDDDVKAVAAYVWTLSHPT